MKAQNSVSSGSNTLTVQIPVTSGQSMPNLSSEQLSPTSLHVPTTKLLSPNSRGTSYPPPSPRSLRRGIPVLPSRNPPLVKTKHITEVHKDHDKDTTPTASFGKFTRNKPLPGSGAIS